MEYHFSHNHNKFVFYSEYKFKNDWNRESAPENIISFSIWVGILHEKILYVSIHDPESMNISHDF